MKDHGLDEGDREEHRRIHVALPHKVGLVTCERDQQPRGHDRSRRITTGHAGSRWVTLGHTGSRQVTLGHDRSRWVMTGHAGSR